MCENANLIRAPGPHFPVSTPLSPQPSPGTQGPHSIPLMFFSSHFPPLLPHEHWAQSNSNLVLSQNPSSFPLTMTLSVLVWPWSPFLLVPFPPPVLICLLPSSAFYPRPALCCLCHQAGPQASLTLEGPPCTRTWDSVKYHSSLKFFKFTRTAFAFCLYPVATVYTTLGPLGPVRTG